MGSRNRWSVAKERTPPLENEEISHLPSALIINQQCIFQFSSRGIRVMARYFVDLRDLAQQKIALEGSFEPGAIDFSSDAIRQIGLLVWSAGVDRAGNEIRITGSVQATVEASCSRCLEPARTDVSRPFDLFLRERDEQMFDEDQ